MFIQTRKGGKIMKKKVLSLLVTGVMFVSLLSGCSPDKSAEESGGQDSKVPEKSTQQVVKVPEKDVTLEWEITATSEKIPVYQEVVDDYKAKTGVNIKLVTPYETVMKTRMASGDLPDLWETHGWSVARYSEYLMILNDQEWFSRVDESILPVISDEDNNIYCLPLTVGINTITYNKDIFEAADVDPYAIRTWADFNEACDKIKATGVAPIFCGNKDSSTISQLCESIPPAYLTLDCVEDNQTDALKDGTFEFAKYWKPSNVHSSSTKYYWQFKVI